MKKTYQSYVYLPVIQGGYTLQTHQSIKSIVGHEDLEKRVDVSCTIPHHKNHSGAHHPLHEDCQSKKRNK